MTERIGIIICDRYRSCAGGKCLRALKNREGAFAAYAGEEVELAGYTSCGGCPGGNIEYAPEEMVRNGVTTVHFATGLLVGYPPCPYLTYFQDFLETRYGMKVVMGTHPIPENYHARHTELKTWESSGWQEHIRTVVCDARTRAAYD